MSGARGRRPLGRYCDNGTCYCRPGYLGADCSIGQCPQGSLGRLAKEETADYQCKTFGKQARLGLGLG